MLRRPRLSVVAVATVAAAALVNVRLGLPMRAQTPAGSTVYAVAYVEVLPSSAAAAKTALRDYRAATRKDDGSVAVDVFERPDRPGHLAVIETWRDPAAFAAHGAAAHTVRLADVLGPLRVSGYDQRPYQPLTIGPRRASTGGQVRHVITHVDTVPGPENDGPGLLTRLAGASRQEPGNLRFDVLQQQTRPNHFTIVEAWLDENALVAHAGAPHTRQYRDALQAFAGGPLDERVYKAVE
jgi:quinol monooxygenase YgiN